MHSPRTHVRLAAFYFAYFAYVGAFTPYFSLYLAARGFGPAQIAATDRNDRDRRRSPTP